MVPFAPYFLTFLPEPKQEEVGTCKELQSCVICDKLVSHMPPKTLTSL